MNPVRPVQTRQLRRAGQFMPKSTRKATEEPKTLTHLFLFPPLLELPSLDLLLDPRLVLCRRLFSPPFSLNSQPRGVPTFLLLLLQLAASVKFTAVNSSDR